MHSCKIGRRGFLRSTAIGVAALAWADRSLAQAAESAVAQPNILFIICDDLNDWVLHGPGHPKAKTPHMDRLRNRSVSFSNAHVAVPVCGPSRKCLFSGLYPQTINDYSFAAWKSVPLLPFR